MLRTNLIVAALVLPVAANAAILEVGSGKAYSTISSAAAAAKDGDTIHIFPGTYTRGAVFTANNLTIMAAPGSKKNSVIVKTGVVNGKGLFNIKGDDAIVDGIKFQSARVADGNGAGIRAEGKNLTVRNSTFYANEMGILITPFSAADEGGTYRVIGSSFSSTKSLAAGHIGHSIYATDGVASLIVESSTFRAGKVGHYIKSRAENTEVRGNRIDDTSGTASYLIEVPQGGGATIVGNTLIKGSMASNCCVAISYGAEMYKGGSYVNAPGIVTIADNSFTNLKSSTVRFVDNRSTPPNPVALLGNTLIATKGSIVPLSGPGSVNGVGQARAVSAILGVSDYLFAAADNGRFTLSGAAAAVPAPATAGLLGLGLGLTLLFRRRR